jgi:hypothetical protein
MAILSTGVDIRPDRCGRGCHFSHAGQTRTRPTNRWLQARVSFSPVGDLRIFKISNFDGFDLVSPLKYPSISKFWPSPIISSTQVSYGNLRWCSSYSPTSFFSCSLIHHCFMIEFTSTLLKPAGDTKPGGCGHGCRCDF